MKLRNFSSLFLFVTGAMSASGCAVASSNAEGIAPSNAEDVATVQASWFTDTVNPAYVELALQNGWTNAPYSTRNAGAARLAWTVQLKGAIATSGTNTVPFTLPAGFRPAANAYVPVDLCNGANGRLLIQPNGVVTVQTAGPFSDAQCFTSLDGVTFGVSPADFTALTLQNGWTNAPYGTGNAAVLNSNGVVHFQGAIATTGSNAEPFTLPIDYRPAADVYVPINLCNSAKGRLYIRPNGVVTVQAQGAFSDAQCFTSLDGASFSQDASGYTQLALENGWTNAPFSTRTAGIASINGVAHFKGAIATAGASAVPFTLPPEFRPTMNVYIPIDLCAATKGRLLIQPSGVVTVVATGGTFSNAQCFTSLDGASFTVSDFTTMTLLNGWTHAPYGTNRAAAGVISGIVQLEGAMSTTGTDPVAFTLPAALRPATNVYTPVNLCNGTKGRLFIQSSGDVTVQTEGGAFSNAQCFTSLEGASFALSTSSFTALTLQNGWTNAPFGTRDAAVANVGGTIRLAGAIATSGTNAVPFTLPAQFSPPTNVYVPIDLCGAAKGRLWIQPNGVVTVSAEGGTFSNAQCFTSLEGVSFALSTSSSTALTPQNGWTNAPFGTRNATATNTLGIIRLAGAIATTGTNDVAFTLPSGLAPAKNAYVSVDLCNATKGRLLIEPSGVVTVESQGAFSNAQCFTSLEGVSFGL
jgi:hypothetical protein